METKNYLSQYTTVSSGFYFKSIVEEGVLIYEVDEGNSGSMYKMALRIHSLPVQASAPVRLYKSICTRPLYRYLSNINVIEMYGEIKL